MRVQDENRLAEPSQALESGEVIIITIISHSLTPLGWGDLLCSIEVIPDHFNTSFGCFYSRENHKPCPLERLKVPPPAGGGRGLQVAAASYLTCMPGLGTARELALRDSSGWIPRRGRHWLSGPWGVTHPSISGGPGKTARASCVLWKATSLVPQLSFLCRAIRLTSSFTPWKSKYHIRLSVFQVQVLYLAFSK